MAESFQIQRVKEKVDQKSFMLFKRLVQSIRYLLNSTMTKDVVFVAGVQRSGTNMMMDVLERSFETDVYHERDERAFQNYEMRDKEVITQLLRQSQAPTFVIKALCELQDLTRLLEEFTPAKVIWVVRHYDDVVNSMLVSFRNHAVQVKRIARKRDSDGWRGRGMSDETHALVQSLVHEDINDASAAALMWYYRNVLFFEQGFDMDDRVALVSYESLVDSPQVEFRRIFNFLGLEYSAQVSNKIFSSSVRRRSPPDIDPTIGEHCENLYKRFQDVLQSQQSTYARAQ